MSEVERPSFTRIPTGRFEWERIVRRVELSAPSVKLLALLMATYADAETGGRIFPGLDRLAAVMGTSRRTVMRCMDELTEVGLIDQVRKGHSFGRGSSGGLASEYQLTAPSDLLEYVPMLDPDEKKQVTPVSRDLAKQVTSRHKQVTPMTETGDKWDETGDTHVTPSISSHQPVDQTTINHDIVTQADAKPVDKSPDELFEQWYGAFPKHEAPGKARAAYKRALKKADADTLLAGAKAYAALRKGEPRKFTKMPATWLNQECWNDEHEPEQPARLTPWDKDFHTPIPDQYAWCNPSSKDKSA